MKRTQINEQQILNYLRTHKKITVDQAILITDSSDSTVRRTFKRLEETGTCLRYFGGLRLNSDINNSSDYYYENTENKNIEAKQKIATLALSFLEDNDVIYLDSGTTLARFAALIADALERKKIKGLTIFTNSLVNLNLLKNHNIILIGGNFRQHRKDFHGYIAEDTLRTLHFKKCFLGTDGFSPVEGFTTTDFMTARLNELALEHSEKKYVLMDSSKFFITSIVSYSRHSLPDLVLSDEYPDSSYPETANLNVQILTPKLSKT